MSEDLNRRASISDVRLPTGHPGPFIHRSEVAMGKLLLLLVGLVLLELTVADQGGLRDRSLADRWLAGADRRAGIVAGAQRGIKTLLTALAEDAAGEMPGREVMVA